MLGMDRLLPLHIKQILAVTDSLRIHRESVSVPLAPRGEGAIRLTDAARVEIVVPAAGDFETWIAGIPAIAFSMGIPNDAYGLTGAHRIAALGARPHSAAAVAAAASALSRREIGAPDQNGRQ